MEQYKKIWKEGEMALFEVLDKEPISLEDWKEAVFECYASGYGEAVITAIESIDSNKETGIYIPFWVRRKGDSEVRKYIVNYAIIAKLVGSLLCYS